MFDADQAYKTLTSQKLTHEQKVMNLAKCSENALESCFARTPSPADRSASSPSIS